MLTQYGLFWLGRRVCTFETRNSRFALVNVNVTNYWYESSVNNYLLQKVGGLWFINENNNIIKCNDSYDVQWDMNDPSNCTQWVQLIDITNNDNDDNNNYYYEATDIYFQNYNQYEYCFNLDLNFSSYLYQITVICFSILFVILVCVKKYTSKNRHSKVVSVETYSTILTLKGILYILNIL